jgi:hypothetical protein
MAEPVEYSCFTVHPVRRFVGDPTIAPGCSVSLLDDRREKFWAVVKEVHGRKLVVESGAHLTRGQPYSYPTWFIVDCAFVLEVKSADTRVVEAAMFAAMLQLDAEQHTPENRAAFEALRDTLLAARASPGSAALVLPALFLK